MSTIRRSNIVLRATVAILAVVAILWLAPPMAFATAGTTDSARKIYLDPDTGEVLTGPARQRAAARAEPANGAKQRGKTDSTHAWTNANGADMLTVDPSRAPAARVVHCPDGSLRMGGVRGASGDTDRDALCAAAHE